MAITVKQVIYLGTFADADTNEGSATVENPGVYQQTFGSAGSPLNSQLEDLTFDDADNNGSIGTDNTGTPDTTEGLGGVAALDSLAVVSGTVTYTDGSTATFNNVVMFQTDNGDLFLANSDFSGTDLRDPGGEPIQSFTVNSIASTNYTGLLQENLQNFTCFAAGTLIGTPAGPRRVEDLAVGDLVDTLDHGAQPIRWIGATPVLGLGTQAPVHIKAGALGPNLPAQDMMVSQQHRVLIRSAIVQRMTGQAEALIAAKALVSLPGVSIRQSIEAITYVHVLFDEHEVVMSNGAPTESLWPGPQALKMLGDQHRGAVQAFLARKGARGIGQMARHVMTGPQRKQVVARHLKNARAIVARPAHHAAVAALSS